MNEMKMFIVDKIASTTHRHRSCFSSSMLGQSRGNNLLRDILTLTLPKKKEDK